MNRFCLARVVGGSWTKRALYCVLFTMFITALPPEIRAQRSDAIPPATRTIAIRNAEIVISPDNRIDNGTVVIQEGLITAVGIDVNIPYDAQIIDGDSLTVYAGFIDGLSHTGIPESQTGGDENGADESQEEEERRVSRANPPDDVAGIQPDRFAHSMLAAQDSSIEALRKAGFTLAHVVPRGAMLPGSGALILLAGDEASDMVLAPDVSLFAQLRGAEGVYPATPMGVMATMRQLYRESIRRKELQSMYAANASGMQRPEYDPVHYAFFPIIDGEKPVFMYANSALEIYRALRLREELEYPLILGGLYEGFESIDLLLDANIPLFVTLKIPDEPGETDSLKTPIPPSRYDPSLHVTDHTDIETERVNLEARRNIFHKQYLSSAASLYEAGLNFGFITKDIEPGDVHKNLRKMIENGLSEDVALAALTTNAAKSFGLSQRLGTVEPGKMANLVVSVGPVFREESYIRYVFVDGRKFEYQKDSNQKAEDSPASAGSSPRTN